MYTTLISATELAEQLAASQTSSQSLVIVDCRFSLADTKQGEGAYQRSRLPGAHYAHLDNDLSSPIIAGATGRHPLPDSDRLTQRFRDWGISNHTQIVAYDDKVGAVASRFWWLSRWLGHTDCAVLDGGFAAWQSAGHEIETSTLPAVKPNTLPGQFKRGVPHAQSVDIDTVAGDTVLLVDAREAERYRGEREPIDPIAGHIPGALNMPFLDNIDPSGCFKSQTALRERFAPLLSQAGDRTLVHYCGSGVTAAHNVLAMTHAGIDNGALYAGSFSEWISRDSEQFPVARQVD